MGRGAGVPYAEHLAALRARTAASSREAEAIAGALDETRLAWSPAPGAWGVAQCLDHLTTTFHAYDRALAGAFARAADRGGPPPGARWTPGLVGGWLIRAFGPDSRVRARAPRVFAPPAEPRPGALARFLDSQRALDRALVRAAGADLVRIRVASPALGLLRYGLGDALTLLVAHVERHLAQARAVREHPGFPG